MADTLDVIEPATERVLETIERGGVDEVDAAVAERTVSLVHECGRELLVWCPDGDPARVLAEAGTDALVVDPVPPALRALAGVAGC